MAKSGSDEPICLLCKSGSTASFMVKHSEFPADIYRCDTCAHGFASPCPNEESLRHYYAQQYSSRRSERIGEAYFELMEDRAQAQLSFFKEHSTSKTLAGAREGADRHVEPECMPASPRLLDIGCGYGAMVATAKQAGWSAIGVDDDLHAIEVAGERYPDTDVRAVPWHGIGPEQARVDTVWLSHLLEHVEKPVRFLSELKAQLGGLKLLYIEVPNTNEFEYEKACGSDSHLHFFTPNTLRLAIEQAGLEVVALQLAGPDVDQLIHVMQHGGIKKLYGDYSSDNTDALQERRIWIRAVARVV